MEEAQLRRAVLEGNLPTVQRILQQPAPGGVNVNAAGDVSGWTALHLAVGMCHLEILQAILRASGVNLNARTNGGVAPLHLACWYSPNARLQVFQALLEAGADPNIAAHDDGCTPLHLAAGLEDKNVAKALLDGGANPAVRNNNLDTPLHHACSSWRLDVVQMLIRRQGSECLTVKNNREETPLDQLGPSRSGVKASIGQHILQSYSEMIAQRDGPLCLHSVLQGTAFAHVAAADGNDKEFVLPVGKLNAEDLQKLLEYIIAMEPGSVCALNGDGMMPLQVASQLNFPDLVLNVLLRPYPGALLVL